GGGGVVGLNGGGSLLHNPSAAGRVQVILDSGLTGEEKFHPIQGKPLCIIPRRPAAAGQRGDIPINIALPNDDLRSEEHTSELQSRETLVCRLLLENIHIR